jgi:phage shock protein E
MFESIKKMLGIGPSVDYASLVKHGAIILDVRTKGNIEEVTLRDQSISL